jgi:hypothetical protein
LIRITLGTEKCSWFASCSKSTLDNKITFSDKESALGGVTALITRKQLPFV